MTLLIANCFGTALDVDANAVAAALANLPPDTPIVVMIHGYRFSPGSGIDCPHQHIFALTPNPRAHRAISWPRHLGFGTDRAQGLCIAFGWQAKGSLWGAYRRAQNAATALAALIALLRSKAPGRRVDIIAHSLGARVALQALHHIAPGDAGRLILLAPAEFRHAASAAMATPAAQMAEVISVTSRENDVFDFILEFLLAGGFYPGLGHGLAAPRANWTDLQLDHAQTVTALANLGFRLPAARARFCHWSPYSRPGVFALYRALLSGDLALPTLRAALPPAAERRWARFLPGAQPLPLPANQA
ncbi:MAG: alpha/beta fold hydrolase [Paracoccaceae bacterium]